MGLGALESFLFGCPGDGIRDIEGWDNPVNGSFQLRSLDGLTWCHQRRRGGQGDPAFAHIHQVSTSAHLCPMVSPHLSLPTLLTKARETQWACTLSPAHNIAQGLVGLLVALCRSLPTWSSWVRLPSAWLWWAATPAALPWSSHPRASPSPWWSPAAGAPACSCLSSFPETGDTEGERSSSEHIGFCQRSVILQCFTCGQVAHTVSK